MTWTNCFVQYEAQYSKHFSACTVFFFAIILSSPLINRELLRNVKNESHQKFYVRGKQGERSFVWFPCPICIEYHATITWAKKRSLTHRSCRSLVPFNTQASVSLATMNNYAHIVSNLRSPIASHSLFFCVHTRMIYEPSADSGEGFFPASSPLLARSLVPDIFHFKAIKLEIPAFVGL